MADILFRCNDIEIPKDGTLTLVIHPNRDVYLGDVLKDIKIGKAIELPPHGILKDADFIISCLEEIKDTYPRTYEIVKGILDRTPTVLGATDDTCH